MPCGAVNGEEGDEVKTQKIVSYFRIKRLHCKTETPDTRSWHGSSRKSTNRWPQGHRDVPRDHN